MALRINTNVAALNAHRQLAITEAKLSSNMEKLSSGYRINRAADDAAGLSVANRLRSTTKSLAVASRNVSEAKGMVNVAEGAVTQIEDILERMKELATQSASANAANDRDKIQAEFLSLQSEISRITESTNYQGTVLLKGTFGNGVSTTSGFTSGCGMTTSEITISGASAGVYTIGDALGVVTITNGTSTQGVAIATATAGTLNFSLFGISLTLNTDHATGDLAASTITVSAAAEGGIFQVGSGNSADNRIGLTIGSLTTTALGINTTSLATQAGAQAALTAIDSAIDTLVGVEGNLGAAVNRMDYTYANLQVSIENLSASESVIRDVDMAGEMVSFTKNQILQSAGTAMLAQANMSSQSVLTLMK